MIEGFKCQQCGKCCKGQGGTLSATEEDIKRWRNNDEYEFVLEYVDHVLLELLGTTDLWFDPEDDGEEMDECPWFEHGVCCIEEVKPDVCRNFPPDLEHGVQFCGCPESKRLLEKK